MERILQVFREYPAVAGVAVFLIISLAVAVVLTSAMLHAGASVKPLVFVFGYLAIIGAPQAAVHLLDAWSHHRATTTAPTRAPSTPTPTSSAILPPVPWQSVFGPDADPSLITDAKRGLEAILSSASEAKIAFSASGEAALAARFPSDSECRKALDGYITFFQWADAEGTDAGGWTGKRYRGQGEWNHVVAAANELYAWSGPTRESVEARRVRALGPLPAGATARPSDTASASISRKAVSNRLIRNKPVMATFVLLNLVLAVAWFFKGSAWAARIPPARGVPAMTADSVRNRLAALAEPEAGFDVRPSPDGKTWEVTWRHADARWFDLMRLHRTRRTQKLVLSLDEASHTARVQEYWSAFDASAGAAGLRLDWKAASGIQFFMFQRQHIAGVQLDPQGRPTGELSASFTFDLQALKAPVVNAVAGAGWTWQPVVWNVPPAIRWLTE